MSMLVVRSITSAPIQGTRLSPAIILSAAIRTSFIGTAMFRLIPLYQLTMPTTLPFTSESGAPTNVSSKLASNWMNSSVGILLPTVSFLIALITPVVAKVSFELSERPTTAIGCPSLSVSLSTKVGSGTTIPGGRSTSKTASA